ncbi:MAG: hypothetical protein JSS86_14295 [Cyanobacteria bacterium SZAS LIN-2]|nr:hypothetical protein [Cyanobacteria bacterium SZAS LIN-2]MBS2010947.1 hypothetical protein [Cyanobacteria bacterium SZAS TMP-1]
MLHNLAPLIIGLLAAAGIGLFVYNMFLARQGFLGMRKARQQMSAAAAERTVLDQARQRSEDLRQQVKERYGKDYALVIEPVDLLVSHSVTALLAHDSASALELLNEACHEMEVLLRSATD